MLQKTKLICIPYAGGNSYSFRDLQPFLGRHMDIVTLELPGRGKRIADPLLSDMHAMADDLYQQLLPHIRSPYLVYGHSMGAVLGNLLIHRLKKEGKALPLHFFVTGCAAPVFNDQRRQLHLLPDDQLIAELKNMGGMPDALLADLDMMEFFLPVIREDMRAVEGYQYQSLGRYSTGITAITGAAEEIAPNQVAGWAEETDKEIRILRYPGNHFFILHQFQKIAMLIREAALTPQHS
ncbi:thioesterase II family protein [Chitinophaga sp. 22321]|uniref:Thioesterase n=1 Tax=Chitinophaga hostae TaxID=2831022 RepID=A0ABS5J8A0_9BACT|nr:alpha/beta fold hydrolase [Chitinophaga hostae]MBS0030642.1 thioesterase [Chitinophaga hostae]